ncbi:DUF4251 domain-containing protein [Sabulilitoribacter multivorans]|uniref:DUF4251 domain-containing protein n=1 Tax=Flaviramulus multivorans TaxID=1304750 RepID=A0ABS9IJC7_9FLAO|nr:DUF4251 domain-containing protein [Flaviramulus multivorans]MCF7560698.1 DUF4251 domain-containing protein [Flaviramulus multivorans]
MKPYYYIISFLFIIMFSCGSSKEHTTDSEIQALTALVEGKQYVIESDWAYPQTTRAMQQVINSGLLQPGNNSASINLIGNPNFLKISGDSISSYLPYFGERQMNVAYGGRDGTIEFKGAIENYQVVKRKDNGYDIAFEADSNSENFKVNITLWPSLKSNIRLISASRFGIRYSGMVKPVTE